MPCAAGGRRCSSDASGMKQGWVAKMLELEVHDTKGYQWNVEAIGTVLDMSRSIFAQYDSPHSHIPTSRLRIFRDLLPPLR